MSGPDGPSGQGGGHRALADPRGARDPDPDAAFLGRDDLVQDLGPGLGIVLDRGYQAGAGEPAAFEKIIPEILPEMYHAQTKALFSRKYI